MNTQTYTVNIRTGVVNITRVDVSQGDTGRTLAFNLYDGLIPFTPPSGSTVTIVGRKPSGLGFNETCTVSGNTAAVNTTLAMTQEPGKFPVELRIESDTRSIGTANFVLSVEPSPHPAGTTDGTTEEARTVLAQCEAYAQEAQEAAEAASGDYTEIRSDVDDLSAEVSQLSANLGDLGDRAEALANFGKLCSIHKNTIVINTVEDGYYSTVNGSKQNNSSSTHYKRAPYLIPVDELSLYVTNIYVNAVCFDAGGTFISTLMLYPRSAANKKNILPANTAFVGLHATNATGFTLEKIDGADFVNAEYPYSDNAYIHLEKCWINGSGSLSNTDNLDLLIVPNISAGERFYISNNASYNCVCFDVSGTLLETTYEDRSPLGRVYTIPDNAVIMYVNLYRLRTKGVNSEMSDYLVKLNDKKILAIGDSLTWLDGRENYGGMARFSGWQRQLKLAGYDVINAGWSGYPYATGLDIVNNVDYSIYKEIVTNTYDVSGYDIIILFGGTNDVLYNGALGGRPTDYSNRTFDASTFNGALGAIISYIRTNNTTALILLASFPKSEAVARSYSNAKSRVDEIKYNADFWSCKYVNIWEDLNIQPTYDGFDQYFYDSTHANFSGMEKIGKLMLNAVKSYM